MSLFIKTTKGKTECLNILIKNKNSKKLTL